MAFLIEKYVGAFPLWLSPVQTTVLPVSEKHAAYAQEIADALREANIRVAIDSSNETLGKKIRNSKKEKVPYLLVVGDEEMNAKTATLEGREGRVGTLSLADTIVRLKEEIRTRS